MREFPDGPDPTGNDGGGKRALFFNTINLLHDLTVLENIMLPLIPLGHPLSTCRRQSMEALKT